LITNFLRTTLLFGILTGFFLAVAWVLRVNPFVALLGAALMNLLVYWMSDSFVLWAAGAREVTEHDYPELHRIVRALASRAGIPMPKVTVADTLVPNAFATGRSPSRAAICVNTGLLQMLDKDELEGVLGHELSHVKNYDTLTSVMAATLAGAIAYIAQWGWFLGGTAYASSGDERDQDQGSVIGALLMMIVAPIAALLIRLAISRTREYAADEAGAKLTGKPEALASALEKIEGWVHRRPQEEGNPALASLYIVNPFRGTSLVELFSTHPSTEKRVKRLEKIARGMGKLLAHRRLATNAGETSPLSLNCELLVHPPEGPADGVL